MIKNERPIHRLKAIIAAMAVIATLLLGTPSPAVAAPTHSVTAVVTAVTAVTHQAVPTQMRPTISGTTICSGAVTAGYKVIYIAAFAIGFCPTWGFFQTPRGRVVSNWVTNVACRVPAIVWAATGGRWTRC